MFTYNFHNVLWLSRGIQETGPFHASRRYVCEQLKCQVLARPVTASFPEPLWLSHSLFLSFCLSAPPHYKVRKARVSIALLKQH